MINLNTKEYWDKRFDGNGNWIENAGDKQSVFFANILCELLPNNIKNEILQNRYTVCDMGCAMGEGTQVFSRELAVNVDGTDFSPNAIEKAKKTFPENHFYTCDITAIPEDIKYDVILCSNVLEHFLLPWNIFHNFAACATKYIILLVPYKEKLQIDEHMYHFSEENIPVSLAGFSLCHCRTVDGAKIPNTFYPDQQILLIYKKADYIGVMLSELAMGVREADKRESEHRFEDLERAAEEKVQKKDDELKLTEQRLSKELDSKEAELSKKEAELSKKDEKLKKIDEEKKEFEAKIQALESEKSGLVSQLEERNKQYDYFYAACANRDRAMAMARDYCYLINGGKSFKISLLLFRFIRQVLKGDKESRRLFRDMIKKRLKGDKIGGAITRDDSFNYLINTAKMLTVEDQSYDVISSGENQNGIIVPNGLNYKTWELLKKEYTKLDVIFLSVISYDFRFQRPQQFAKRFAENGHRVFYVNADFNRKEGISLIAENLYAVDLFSDKCNAIYYAETDEIIEWMKDSLRKVIYQNAISDAVVIVDYPNWVDTALALRKEFGFKLVTDYMDDYTGFMTTTTEGLKDRCLHLLQESDSVISSSNFLYDIASKYSNKVTIIRNGTETDHFKIKSEKRENERPIIGYYGAISEWFDWEKICYVAKNMPDCDVVLIGDVTHNRAKFERYSNIKLLGEMKYADLPNELEKFDVCLIPFDTSTDLIKATNPVKFYEYLSAGKKVVATEIPELEPFKDEYVYMSNDNKRFTEYIRLCIENKDTLKDGESCVKFAEENDWQKRYDAFYNSLSGVFPKVSIVVLTYNNLELNKECIQSVLQKTAYPNYELIILDNQSTDGTIEYLKELQKEDYPTVRIIFNDENSGFAGGNNKAIEVSEGEYVVLLNNDTVVTRGWLSNWVKHFVNDTKVGMIGAVTNSIGNEAMISVQYHNKSELASFAYQYTSSHRNEVYRDIDRIAMFAVMIRRDIINEYGALDDSYKVGMFEDDDYAMVVKKAGYDFYLAEDVFIHHVNNASFKKLESDEYKIIFETNKRLFEKKWNVEWKTPKYRDGVEWNSNLGMMVEPR